MSKKNITVTIPTPLYQTIDFLDNKYREFTMLARMMNEEIIRTQGGILQKENPELFEKYRKGFVRVEVDWKNKTLVVIPTDDPEKKGQEVAEALNNHARTNKNSN